MSSMKYNFIHLNRFLRQKFNIVIVSNDKNNIISDLKNLIILKDLSLNSLRSLVDYAQNQTYLIQDDLHATQSSVLLKPIEEGYINCVFLVSSLQSISPALISRSVVFFHNIEKNNLFKKDDFKDLSTFLQKIEFTASNLSYSLNEILLNLMLFLYKHYSDLNISIIIDEINIILNQDFYLDFSLVISNLILKLNAILFKS